MRRPLRETPENSASTNVKIAESAYFFRASAIRTIKQLHKLSRAANRRKAAKSAFADSESYFLATKKFFNKTHSRPIGAGHNRTFWRLEAPRFAD
jgi:hypothetical protein